MPNKNNDLQSHFILNDGKKNSKRNIIFYLKFLGVYNQLIHDVKLGNKNNNINLNDACLMNFFFPWPTEVRPSTARTSKTGSQIGENI